jgi:hypothetical protein
MERCGISNPVRRREGKPTTMAGPSCTRHVAEHTSATAERPRPGVATPMAVAVYWSLGGRD